MSAGRESTTSIEVHYDWVHRIYSASCDPDSASSDLFSDVFDSRTIPNVRFRIFGVATYNNTYTVIILKTPSTLRNGKIQILILDVDRKTVDLTESEDEYILVFDIPIGLKDRDIPFKCKITWDGYPESQSISKRMKNFLGKSDYSDIVMKIDTEEIPVHKVILAAQSPVFHTMFETNITESTQDKIIVNDIEVDIMKKAIEYMYTNAIASGLDIDTILSILKVADKYDIADLEIFCKQKLYECISNDNVMKILEKIDFYQDLRLSEALSSYMIENKSSIIHSKDFKQLYLRKPELFFEFIVGVFAKFPEH